MFVEVTPENIGKVIGTAIAAAFGGGATIASFFWGLRRYKKLFSFYGDGKKSAPTNAGEVLRQSACAIADANAVTNQLKELVTEIRENAKCHRDVFQDILKAQQQIVQGNAIVLQNLQTLMLMRGPQ